MPPVPRGGRSRPRRTRSCSLVLLRGSRRHSSGKPGLHSTCAWICNHGDDRAVRGSGVRARGSLCLTGDFVTQSSSLPPHTSFANSDDMYSAWFRLRLFFNQEKTRPRGRMRSRRFQAFRFLDTRDCLCASLHKSVGIEQKRWYRSVRTTVYV